MLFSKYSYVDWVFVLLTKTRALGAGWGGGEVLLNQTIVSDVAWLHLDFILCDDSLQLISNKPAPVFSKGVLCTFGSKFLICLPLPLISCRSSHIWACSDSLWPVILSLSSAWFMLFKLSVPATIFTVVSSPSEITGYIPTCFSTPFLCKMLGAQSWSVFHCMAAGARYLLSHARRRVKASLFFSKLFHTRSLYCFPH